MISELSQFQFLIEKSFEADEIIAEQKVKTVQQLSVELEMLENQLQEVRINSYYNESRGLSNQQLKKIKKMKIGATKKDCSICCLQFNKGDVIMKLPCQHIFHEKCLKPWLKQSTVCPLCRADFQALQ